MQFNKISFASVLKQKAKVPRQADNCRLQTLRQIFNKYEENPHCQYTLFLASDNKTSIKRTGSNLKTSNILNSKQHSEASQMFDSWIQKQTQINRTNNTDLGISNIGKSLNLKENMKNHNQIIKDSNKNQKKIILNAKSKIQAPTNQSKGLDRIVPSFNQGKFAEKYQQDELQQAQKSKQEQKSTNIFISKAQDNSIKIDQKEKGKGKNERKKQIILQQQKDLAKQVKKQCNAEHKYDDLKIDLDLIDEQIINLAHKYKKQQQQQQEEDQQLLISQSFRTGHALKKIVKNYIEPQGTDDEKSNRRWEEAKIKLGGYLKSLEKKKQSLSIPMHQMQEYKYQNREKQEQLDDERYRKPSEQGNFNQEIEIPMLRFSTPRAQNINIPHLKEVQSERVPTHQENQQRFNDLFPQKQKEHMPFVRQVQMAESISYLHTYPQDPIAHRPLVNIKDDNWMHRLGRHSYEEPISPQIQFKISPKTEHNNNQYLQKYMDVSSKESLVYTAQKPQILINIPADFDQVQYQETNSRQNQSHAQQAVHNLNRSANFTNLAYHTQPIKQTDSADKAQQSKDEHIVMTANDFNGRNQNLTMGAYQSYTNYGQNAIQKDKMRLQRQPYMRQQVFRNTQNNSLLINNSCINKLVHPEDYFQQLIKQSTIEQNADCKVAEMQQGMEESVGGGNNLQQNMKNSIQNIENTRNQVNAVETSFKQDILKPKTQNSSKKYSPSNQFCIKKVYSSPKTLQTAQASAPATSNFSLGSDNLQLKKSIQQKLCKGNRVEASFLKIDTVAYTKLECDKYVKNQMIRQEEEEQFKFEL